MGCNIQPMGDLTGRLIRHVPSPDGPQADVALIEPNGDEHAVRCLIRRDGTDRTDIGGDGETLSYLNAKYGNRTVCFVAQGVVLGI